MRRSGCAADSRASRFFSEHQLFFIVSRLRHRLPYDQLQIRLYRCLRVVRLHHAICTSHDARFRIGEVVLVLVFRFDLLGIAALCGGLLARSFLQDTLGFLDLV